MKQKETYIFLSRSGGGKGTQIALLEEHIKDNDIGEVFHMEAGDQFRKFIARDTYTSELAREINDKGQLQPSFLAVWAWGQELIEGLKEHHILIVDGNPRQLDEAEMLVEALDFYGRNKAKFILIDVSKEWAIERMKDRKREDDKSDESRTNRLAWFDNCVVPVIEYFDKDPDIDFIKVNGEQSIKEVHNELIEKLGL